MAIVGYIVLTFKFQKLDGRWTAYCEELGTATFGRSLSEAGKRLKEAVWLHLNTLEEVGERKRFFKEHNIQLHHSKPKKDIIISLPPRPSIFVQPHIQPIRELSFA